MNRATWLLITLGGLIYCSCNSNNALDGDQDLINVPNVVNIELDNESFILLNLDISYTGTSSLILERSTGGDFEVIPHQELSRTALRDTSYDREADHAFIYRIRLQIGEYLSDYSIATPYQYITSQLIMPEALQLVTLESQGVQLSWQDKSGNEESYKIEKNVGAGYQQIAVLNANANGYFDAINGLYNPAIPTNYRVQAHNDTFASQWVEVHSNYTGLGNPTNLHIADTSFHSFILAWEDNSNLETAYTLERLKNDGQYEEIAELAPDVTEHLEFQSATGFYRYRIRAKRENVYSDYSNETTYFVTHELPTEGLTVHWPLDGNADDVLGNNHGSVLGATLVPDRFGSEDNAYRFDGNDWITVEDSPTLALGDGPFTFSTWISLAEYGSEGGYYLLSHSEGAGNATKWFFWLANDGIHFIQHPIPGLVPLGTTTYTLNRWYHIAVQRNGNDLIAYVDGEVIGVGPLFVDIIDPDGVFQIGTEAHRPNGVFRGLIDDVRFYKRALSEEEIKTLYHEGGWGN